VKENRSSSAKAKLEQKTPVRQAQNGISAACGSSFFAGCALTLWLDYTILNKTSLLFIQRKE
jgi:hypothetical protein